MSKTCWVCGTEQLVRPGIVFYAGGPQDQLHVKLNVHEYWGEDDDDEKLCDICDALAKDFFYLARWNRDSKEFSHLIAVWRGNIKKRDGDGPRPVDMSGLKKQVERMSKMVKDMEDD